MKFQEVTEHFQSFYCSDCSNYKVAKYGKLWSAYFKLDGWVNFGNSCEKTRAGECCEYSTKKLAINACERHLAKFGERTHERNHLTEGEDKL